MLLARRRPPSFRERLSLMLWPRRSWGRSARYFGLRLMRQAVAPDVIARGVAVGLFVATLPLFGLQMILAVVLAVALRGNVPAALLATFWANPVTIPLLLGLSYLTGAQVMGLDAVRIAADFDLFAQVPLWGGGLQALGHRLAPVFLPLLIGSVPLAIAVSGVGYVAVYVGMTQLARSRELARGLSSRAPAPDWSDIVSREAHPLTSRPTE